MGGVELDQLAFEDARLRLVASSLPPIRTPVVRWRRIVTNYGPRNPNISRPLFQAVAGVLANHARRDGTGVRLAVATIAGEAGCSTRSARYALSDLEAWHLIRADRSGGRARPGRFDLAIPAVDNPGDEL